MFWLFPFLLGIFPIEGKGTIPVSGLFDDKNETLRFLDLSEKYRIYRKSLAWRDALNFCSKCFGSFATFGKAEEVKEISEWIYDVSYFDKEYDLGHKKHEWGLDRRYWIGLTDEPTEGKWAWYAKAKDYPDKGIPLKGDVKAYPWVVNQPDHIRSKKEEHCVGYWNPVFHLDTTKIAKGHNKQIHKLNDYNCMDRMYFICKNTMDAENDKDPECLTGPPGNVSTTMAGVTVAVTIGTTSSGPATGTGTTPKPSTGSTSAPVSGGTTPAHATGTTPSPSGGTTPAHTTGSTSASSGATTPAHSSATTPSPVSGGTTPPPSSMTTPSPGGSTTEGFLFEVGDPYTPDEVKDSRELFLKFHNVLRSWHRAPPMVYDDKLHIAAQEATENLVRLGKMKHTGFGENLYQAMHSAGDRRFKALKEAHNSVREWYWEFCDEEHWPPRSLNHFTQVVWNDSIKLGLGLATNKVNSQVFFVGRYDPYGNYEGEYDAGVHPTRCPKEKICKILSDKTYFPKEEDCPETPGMDKARGFQSRFKPPRGFKKSGKTGTVVVAVRGEHEWKERGSPDMREYKGQAEKDAVSGENEL